MHSPSWRATPLDLKGEAHEHFLSGINQLIGHGWPCSPADAPGLGWFFYAAGALSDRNPWWPAMPELTAYLHRLSWLLRQGEHVADVKIYLPAGDIARSLGGSLDLWREAKRYIGDDLPRIVREAGYDFDVVDDDALAVLDPEHVPVVLLPDSTVLPPATQEWLGRVQQLGGSVLAVGASGPADVRRVRVEELAGTLPALLEPDVRLGPASRQVGVVHRRTQRADVYFLANTGPSPVSFPCSVRTERERVEEWDPQRGSVRRSASASSPVQVTLQPYEATVLVFFDGDAGAGDRGPQGSAERRPLPNPWRLRYLDTDLVRDVALPHRWEDDPGRDTYSGGAAYETAFEVEPSWLEAAAHGRVRLDFGPSDPVVAGSSEQAGIRGSSYRVEVSPPVREVAVVSLNDQPCGVLWAPPYVVDLTGALQPGENRLRVVVYNTAANALSADTHIHALAEQSASRYGRRFRMQDLDLALDGVSSGLHRVPELVRESS